MVVSSVEVRFQLAAWCRSCSVQCAHSRSTAFLWRLLWRLSWPSVGRAWRVIPRGNVWKTDREDRNAVHTFLISQWELLRSRPSWRTDRTLPVRAALMVSALKGRPTQDGQNTRRDKEVASERWTNGWGVQTIAIPFYEKPNEQKMAWYTQIWTVIMGWGSLKSHVRCRLSTFYIVSHSVIQQVFYQVSRTGPGRALS